MQRVVDHDRLLFRLDDDDRVGLLRAPDRLQAEVGYRVPAALDEPAQFVVPERVLGRACEAELAGGIDSPHRFGTEQGTTVAQLSQALFR
jgi:hypothetical protein